MAITSALQECYIHTFGAAPLDDASLTTSELDVGDFAGILVICGIGTTATATSTPTVFSVHASDTASLTPGSGNKITGAEVTSGFPTAANTQCAIYISEPGMYGRYMDVLVTVGNGSAASDIYCIAICFPKRTKAGTAISERNVTAFVDV